MNVRSGFGWIAIVLLLLGSGSDLRNSQMPQTDELALSQMRFKKGLELIRLLYEKILSLDHHFSAMHTDQLVQALCTPGSYEGFREFMHASSRRPMPAFVFENPHLAAGFFLAEVHAQPGPTGMDAEAREQLFCLLDFALDINADLHLIYYETAYLIQSNSQLQQECLELFEDYTQVIGYTKTLDQCRNTDDWEAVFLALEQHIQSMRRRMETGAPADQQQLLRDHINLEFSVDRLLNFMRNYQVHIQQGGRYYQKFQLILDHHTLRAACQKNLPEAWMQLRFEINQSVESFHKAYEVPEFKGSSLKDLLYGFTE
ncbi:MAG: hypothetical protein IPL49_09990 [Saprospirales bacterium]|nr:hypothetical protein [Saprospirales bacterium]